MTAADHNWMIAYLAGMLLAASVAALACRRARRHSDDAARYAGAAWIDSEAANVSAGGACAACRRAERLVGGAERAAVDAGCVRATVSPADPDVVTIDSGAGLRLADLDDTE